MSVEAPAGEKGSPKRLFVPSLVLAVFATGTAGAVLTLFLPEIAETFLGSTSRASIGVAGQTSAVNNTAEVVLAFLMSIMAVRFRHKWLLLAGSVLVAFSSFGTFFAPDFFTFQIFFAMEGAGSVIVSILAFTLIGDTLPFNKKPRAISYVSASLILSGLIGMIVLYFLGSVAGWRSGFLILGVPLSIAGLILVFFGVQSKSRAQQTRTDKGAYVRAFKQVLLNKSAFSCLIGRMVASMSVVGLFVLTFYRQQLLLSQGWALGIALINGGLFVIGSLAGGLLINRFGSKPVTVVCGFISGVLTAAFFSMPNLWLTMAFNFASVIIGACVIPAIICLTVDQVPGSRVTMLSIHRIVGNAGDAIGAAVGGAILALFSWQVLGIGFGAFMIASAAIFLFLVKQPTET
jgi:DHA1 family inner membrane transport protein